MGDRDVGGGDQEDLAERIVGVEDHGLAVGTRADEAQAFGAHVQEVGAREIVDSVGEGECGVGLGVGDQLRELAGHAGIDGDDRALGRRLAERAASFAIAVSVAISGVAVSISGIAVAVTISSIAIAVAGIRVAITGLAPSFAVAWLVIAAREGTDGHSDSEDRSQTSAHGPTLSRRRSRLAR